MKWAEMSKEERNLLIHEKVMGGQAHCPNSYPTITFNGYQILEWRCQQCGQTGRGGAVHDPTTGGYLVAHSIPNIPPYTTDMNAAWLIIQKMPTRHHEQAEFLDEPFARFTDELLPNRAGEIWTAYNCMATEVAHWTAEKICMAALKACGVEIE